MPSWWDQPPPDPWRPDPTYWNNIPGDTPSAWDEYPGKYSEQAGAPAVVIPFPAPTPTPSVPFPFPTGPAANDPIFGPKFPGLSGAILGGVIVQILYQYGKKVLKDLEQQKEARQAAEREATYENERARIRRRIEIEKSRKPQTFPPSEVIVTAPVEIPTPKKVTMPLPDFEIDPVEIPEPTRPTMPAPEPALEPLEIPAPTLPKTAPETQPTPASLTVPQTKPAPTTRPGTRPWQIPWQSPWLIPWQSPWSTPRSIPRRIPLQDPVNIPKVLTPVEPVQLVSTPYSFAPNPEPQPETDPDRCQRVQRRRRRKGKCREGFFREYPGETKYVTWRTVDCATRRSTGSNVINFPRF